MRVYQNIFGILENSAVCNLPVYFVLNCSHLSITRFYSLTHSVIFLNCSSYLRTTFYCLIIYCSFTIEWLIHLFIHESVASCLSYVFCFFINLIMFCFLPCVSYLLFVDFIFLFINCLFVDYSFFVCRTYALLLAIYCLSIDLLFIFHSYILIFLHSFCIV